MAGDVGGWYRDQNGNLVGGQAPTQPVQQPQQTPVTNPNLGTQPLGTGGQTSATGISGNPGSSMNAQQASQNQPAQPNVTATIRQRPFYGERQASYPQWQQPAQPAGSMGSRGIMANNQAENLAAKAYAAPQNQSLPANSPYRPARPAVTPPEQQTTTDQQAPIQRSAGNMRR